MYLTPPFKSYMICIPKSATPKYIQAECEDELGSTVVWAQSNARTPDR